MLSGSCRGKIVYIYIYIYIYIYRYQRGGGSRAILEERRLTSKPASLAVTGCEGGASILRCYSSEHHILLMLHNHKSHISVQAIGLAKENEIVMLTISLQSTAAPGIFCIWTLQSWLQPCCSCLVAVAPKTNNHYVLYAFVSLLCSFDSADFKKHHA